MADADSPETRPQPPPMIGSYRLVEPLGSGGMSSVFLARHVETDHEVAVKVLPRYLAKNPTLLQRFIKEARSAESLEHPNIVAIYDRGSEAGRHYLVLEYVPGGDLHDRVREKGPMGLAESIDVMIQIAAGLRHAAGRGLIHRDIKPANVLITPEGKVKITDLGLALHTEEEDERVTRDGTTVGTVDYMAPEQARDSRAASVRSDIYSLGCTLFFLLAGQSPFAGGDIAEKLRSHAIEPPPDIRLFRPEAPESLAALIRKMMAKRAEKRHADYDKLIEVLEAIGAEIRGESPPTKPEVLFALIDDEDDAGPPAPADDAAGPLYALIDDDDAEEQFTLGPSKAAAPEGSTASTHNISAWAELDEAPRSGRGASSLADVNLSGLAGIEDNSPRMPSAPRRSDARPALPPPTEEEIAGPVDPYGLEEPIAADRSPVFHHEPPGTPLSTWVFRFAVLGLIAAIGVATWTWIGPRYFEDDTTPPEARIGDETDPEKGKGQVKVPPWSEPADQEAARPTEPPPPTETLSALGMGGAEEEIAPRAEAPFVEVRRVDTLRDRNHVADLRRAFETLGGTVDVADDGPFHEQEFRISGPNRVVRARPGFRPIVVLEPPSRDSVRGASAVIELDARRSLFLEGIDFVVKGSDLGPKQEAIFLCRGSELTLRDCTITVIGPLPRPFAVVQMGEPGAHPSAPPSRVRIERTLIRGAASQAIRFYGAGDLIVARSAIFAGAGPAVVISGGANEARTISVFRSTIAASGPIFELAGAAGGSAAKPPRIESCQSSFARLAGASSSSPMIGLRDVPAGGARNGPVVAWSGDENSFAGLKEWTTSSPPGLLAGLRAMAKASDRNSTDDPQPLPASVGDPWGVEARRFTPKATALPSPRLREKTVESFGPRVATPRPPATEPPPLRFDAGEPTEAGDLGKFVEEALKTSKSRRLRVVVRGKGLHTTTPVRMPEGVSLEMIVERPASGAPSLSLVAAEGSVAEALFSVRNADLTIAGARLQHDARSPGMPSLVSVDHGALSLEDCLLTSPREAGIGNGSLIRFRTDGTRPLISSTAAYPWCRLSRCVMITGTAALTAEVGRGVVDLSHCAIAAGSTAIALKPENVRRDRFEADLRLDRCTIASEQTLVSVGAWSGLAPGPDRPWVVSSRACVFLDTYERGGTPSPAVLLRTDPAGLSQGVLLWESSGDVFDVTHFTAAGEGPPSFIARPDVQRQWAELWGPSHVRDASGPRPGGTGPAARLIGSRLKPGDIEPKDLALDPQYPPGRKALDVGADLGKMGVLK